MGSDAHAQADIQRIIVEAVRRRASVAWEEIESGVAGRSLRLDIPGSIAHIGFRRPECVRHAGPADPK